ncbi:MAG TPA: DUF3048 C-terminal domain-containing protein [Coriobacteriia bacterium]
MLRRTSSLVAFAAVLALALCACSPRAELRARWPRADRERSVARPSETALWPLTGKPAIDDTAAASSAVLLAVADEPAAASLPGLDSADVVYEVALGGKDVIAALFQSSLPSSAGPLRVASGADGALAAAYRARLAGRPQSGGAALADVASLAAIPATAGVGAPPPGMFGAQEASTSAGSATQIDVPLAAGSKAEWHYDVASGAYQRFVDAKPALAGGSKLIRATNVIVIWVPPQAVWPDPAMTGSGRASVFVAGRKYVGSWETSGGPPSLRDLGGVPIALLPGNTWYEVVGTAANIVLH